jgi:hypothetical protein
LDIDKIYHHTRYFVLFIYSAPNLLLRHRRVMTRRLGF